MEELSIKKLDISINELWRNCVLSSLARAIFIWQCPELSYEQSWDGFNYCFNDSSGTRGTITFFNDEIGIGAVQNLNVVESKNIDLYKRFLEEMPDNIKDIATEEAYRYILGDVNGNTQPIATLVFWSNENQLYLIDPYDNLNEDNLDFVNSLFLPHQELLEYLEEDMELSDSNMTLLQKLYGDFIKKDKPVLLTKEDINLMECTENLEVSIESFNELGIFLES